MNGVDGWMDGWTDNSGRCKSSSPVDDLVLWDLLINTGLGTMVRGGESPLWGAAVSLRNPWMAGVSASGLSSAPSWTDMMLQSSSALCVPQRNGLLAWVPFGDLSVEKAWNSRGILQRRPSGGKRSNHTWHHMPGPGSPCPCPSPHHPESETGYPTPFPPLFLPCWPCFSYEIVLIHNGWLGFFFQRQKNLIHVSSVDSPKTRHLWDSSWTSSPDFIISKNLRAVLPHP